MANRVMPRNMLPLDEENDGDFTERLPRGGRGSDAGMHKSMPMRADDAGRNMPEIDPGDDEDEEDYPASTPIKGRRKGKASIFDVVAGMGRKGDTALIHARPKARRALKAMGGAGTRNPFTGLREYADAGETDPDNDRDIGNTDGTGTAGAPSSGSQSTAAHRASEDKSMAALDAMGKYGLGFGEMDPVIGNTTLGLGMRAVMGIRDKAEQMGLDVRDATPGNGDPEGGGGDFGADRQGPSGAVTPGGETPPPPPGVVAPTPSRAPLPARKPIDLRSLAAGQGLSPWSGAADQIVDRTGDLVNKWQPGKVEDAMPTMERGRSSVLEMARAAGTGGDTDIVHVNESEKAALAAMGGRGDINPVTGLQRFEGGEGGYQWQTPVQEPARPYPGIGNDQREAPRLRDIDRPLPEPEGRNWGANPDTNRKLAEQTGYTGDFGSGGFQRFMAGNVATPGGGPLLSPGVDEGPRPGDPATPRSPPPGTPPGMLPGVQYPKVGDRGIEGEVWDGKNWVGGIFGSARTGTGSPPMGGILGGVSQPAPNPLGARPATNALIAGRTGYGGAFGQGQFQQWLARQQGGDRSRIESTLGDVGVGPNASMDWGRDEELNRLLAGGTGYTGDFGTGGYQAYLQDNPGRRGTSDAIQAAVNWGRRAPAATPTTPTTVRAPAFRPSVFRAPRPVRTPIRSQFRRGTRASGFSSGV